MTSISQASIEEAFKNDETLKGYGKQISKDIINKSYDVSEFVENLGFALTSPSVEQRVNGTKLLSVILKEIPEDFLNEKQITFLATFYADRSKDHHNVIPTVIDGMDALFRMKQIPSNSLILMIQSLFLNTTCQSQVRGDRFKILNILKYLIENNPKEVKEMSGDFLANLVNSIDGERDPRNLDLIFSFMPNFITNFPLLHMSEEMFEVFACYFPIDFTPSANDPDTITRDKLSQELIQCLVASPDFVEWTVSLALEKLESDLNVAKMDSLQLLSQGALKFPVKSLEPHFEQIWLMIKNEIFPGGDKTDIISAGLQTLKLILEQASKEKEISKNYQTIIFGVILTHLSDVNQRLFNPATSIALVCVSGDPEFASEKILNTFLLKMERSSDDSNSLNDEQQTKIFNIIAQIFKIASLKEALDKINSDICTQLHNKILKLLISNTKLENGEDLNQNEVEIENGNDNDNDHDNNHDNRKETMKDVDVVKPESTKSLELIKSSLNVLNESIPLISEANRALFYKILVQIVTDTVLDLDLSMILKQLGSLYPIELQSNFIDVCIKNFPIFSNSIKKKIYKNLLPLVPQLAFTERVLDLVQTNVWSPNTTNEVRQIALDAFYNLLKQQNSHFIKGLQQSQNLIEKLINLAKRSSIDNGGLEFISAILSLIIQQLEISEQYCIVTEYLPNLNLQLASDLFIAKGLLGFLHKDISLDDHFERLLEDLTQISLKNDQEQIREVAHHLLCSLVNKIEQNETNKKGLAKIIEKLKNEIKKGDKKAVEALSWLAKGLIVRGANEAGEIVEALAELLDHPSLATAAVLGFDIISAEFPQLHLPIIKFLYKQKFFHLILYKLGAKLESYCEHHLNAFIFVLKATPHTVLKIHIEKVGPILFKCLETSTNVHTLCMALEICENFVKQQDEYIKVHLKDLLPQCLKLAQNKDSMNVRIKALNLLFDITKYPTFILMPHKTDVILDLSKSLDDHKRLVRKAAVDARNAWYLIGAPGSSE